MARVTKDELRGNELEGKLEEIMEFFKGLWQKHRERIIIGALVGGVCVLFLVIFILTSIRSGNEASRKFNAGLITYSNTNASPKDRYESAKRAFEQLLQENPRTSSARESLLYLGNCYYFLGEYDKAIETYKKGVSGLSKTSVVYALEGIGKSYEGKGDLGSALQAYQDAATKYPKHFLLPLIRLDTAGCYEKMGKTSEAAAEYQKIIDADTKSAWAIDAKTRMNLMVK